MLSDKNVSPMIEGMTLLPCPFCGGEAKYECPVGAGYTAVCQVCGVRGGWGDYGYQARDLWNRRAYLSQPAQAVDIGAIREVIAFMEARTLRGAAWERPALDKLTRAISGEKAGRVDGGRYRLLGPGDVIGPDDEFIDENAVDWVPLKSMPATAQLFVGMQYRLGTLKQARRPIPASTTPDKQP